MAHEFPPPRDWQDFEDLCWDLWRRIWNDPDAQKYGLQGQEQFGVDIVGRRAGGGIEGVQCKQKKRRLRWAEVEEEIGKARRFRPKLTRFIVVTTAPKDPSLQSRILALNEFAERPFAVSVFAWEDLLQELQAYPELIAKYSPAYGKGEVEWGVLPVPNLPPHYLLRPEDLEPGNGPVAPDP